MSAPVAAALRRTDLGAMENPDALDALGVARRGADGDISLTALALGLQATVAALMLAAYYPESVEGSAWTRVRR